MFHVFFSRLKGCESALPNSNLRETGRRNGSMIFNITVFRVDPLISEFRLSI